MVRIRNIECREFYYRRTGMGAITEHIVIHAEKWMILKPTKIQRSRTGNHGEDIYCLSPDEWKDIIDVRLERSNSGRIYYNVIAYDEKNSDKTEELKQLLDKCATISEMIDTVRLWVAAKGLASKLSG